MLYRNAVARLVLPVVSLPLLMPLPSALGATSRWAASSNRIYVEKGGVTTLTQIKAALPNAPLELLDPAAHIWMLRANIIVADGTTLQLHGPSLAGGDVGELRLLSNNSTNTNSVVSVTADWGTLDIDSTRIVSWDEAANGPDTEHALYGRAFVRVRSSLAADGITTLQSRMDIRNSEIGYLGSDASEGYGLSWRVIGTHPDPAKSILDYVQVFGEIRNSHIHHNYYGIYTFGLVGGEWFGNEVDHNFGYGFDLHDDSDRVFIHDNTAHDNGYHGIIASKRCDHLVIRHNLSYGNARNGIMLHRHCDDSVIEGNTVFSNRMSGITILDTDRTVVFGNTCLSNVGAGIRLSLGAADNRIEGNRLADSAGYGFQFYAGGDPPEPDEVDPTISARPRRNQILNNLVAGTGLDPIRISDVDDTLFAGNTITQAAGGIRISTCAGIRFGSNSIPDNILIRIAGAPTFDSSLHVYQQPLLNLQFSDLHASVSLEDAGGAVFDDIPGSLLSTQVGPGVGGGSRSLLTQSTAGPNVTIITRDLQVSSPGGDVIVTPTLWRQGGDHAREWTARAAVPPTGPVSFRIHGLPPSQPCSILRNGVPWMTPVADADGAVVVTDTLASPAGVAYSLHTTVQLAVTVGAAGGVELRWPTTNGAQYQVQTSEDLVTWTDASSPIPGTGLPGSWTQDPPGPKGAAPPAHLFYRIRVLP